LHGWPSLKVPTSVHVTQTVTPNGSAGAGLTRHRRPVPPFMATTLNGIPVTSKLRTAADCAMNLDDLAALVVLDAALSDGVAREDLQDLFDELRGHRGVHRARRRLALANPLAESPGETITRYRFHQLGWPEPELQIPVQTPGGLYYLDMGWRELGLGVEYDGEVKYRELGGDDPAGVVIREKRRGDDIDTIGWTLA